MHNNTHYLMQNICLIGSDETDVGREHADNVKYSNIILQTFKY